MKICIPVQEAHGLDSKVFSHFATAPFYALYNLESSALVFIPNNDPPQGGRVLAEVVRKARVDAVLCKGLGARAVNELAAAGIQAALVDAATAAEAVARYRKNNMRLLEPTAAG
jgi:predicted Fe-Mo cluster-binding NifX family protein